MEFCIGFTHAIKFCFVHFLTHITYSAKNLIIFFNQLNQLRIKFPARIDPILSFNLEMFKEFGVYPKGNSIEAVEWAKENDRPFLEALCDLRLEEIVSKADAGQTICGGGAAAALAGFVFEAGCKRGLVLAHTSSHDRTPLEPADHFVNYAALAFAVE